MAFPFSDPAVAEAFATFPDTVRAPLSALRHLVLETAVSLPRIGEIVETLKWGEPAFLPKKLRIRTTMRINPLNGSLDGYAVSFHCQTTLVDSFRQLYSEQFAFEGNRALIFTAGDPLPTEALRH